MHPSARVSRDALARSQRWVEALDHECPLGIGIDERQFSSRSPTRLILEKIGECVGASSKTDDRRRQPTRLDAYRDRRRGSSLRDQHE